MADVSKMYPIPIDYKMPQFPQLNYDYKKDFEGEKFILLMFNILDPMNVGAMLRSAFYFGVTKVILAGTVAKEKHKNSMDNFSNKESCKGMN